MRPATPSNDMTGPVRAELERIVASRTFAGADRASRFLTFVVEKALVGQTGQLKEYLIGVEALGRKPSFDPRMDPIVRVEAGRLRARLSEFYRTDGRDDGLVITLPKGGYVPNFERRENRPRSGPHYHRRHLVLWTVALSAAASGVAWYAWRQVPHRKPLVERQLTTNSAENPIRSAAISPDGKYLAYADSNGIHVRLIASAETHTLSSEEVSTMAALDWFPDSTRLLFSGAPKPLSVPSLWTVSILGGSPRKQCDGAEGGVASADGSRIAYATADGRQIWLMEPNGQPPHPILTLPEEDFLVGLAWGRDQRHVVYARRHQGTDKFDTSIEYCDVERGEHKILVEDRWLTGSLVVLSDRPIYARRELSPRQTDCNLWEISVDQRTGRAAGKPRRITNWSGFSIFHLSATMDGTHLTFLRGKTQADVYVADLEGGPVDLSNVRRLTFDESNDIPFSWTPDSRTVLFRSDRNGTFDIFKQGIDQPTAETVVASPENDDLPKVTPDGLWIIYLTYPKDTYILHAERRIWRIPLAGGPAVPIMAAHAGATVRCTRSGAIPCVLNERGTDGKQLLFYAFDPLLGKGRELARMDSSFASYFPWNVSPDGSYVALAVPGERTGHIRLLPLAGGAVRDVLVNNWRGFQSISWAPDGNGWYVSSYMPLSSTLLYIDLQGHAQPLRENVEWAVPSPNGRHLALLEWTTASNAWMIENF